VDVRLSKLSVRPQVQGLSNPLSCWSAFNERSENFSPVADSRRDGRVGWSKFGNPWLSDGQLVDWIIKLTPANTAITARVGNRRKDRKSTRLNSSHGSIS